MRRVYLIPVAVHPTIRWPTGVTHHGALSPAAPETHLVMIDWGTASWEDRERFEVQAGLLALGDPWEPVPPAAIAVLEAWRQSFADVRTERFGAPAKGVARVATVDATVAIDGTHTVAQAVRKAAPHLDML